MTLLETLDCINIRCIAWLTREDFAKLHKGPGQLHHGQHYSALILLEMKQMNGPGLTDIEIQDALAVLG